MTLSVEDRLDILELLARADDAASARDADAYVTLFSEAVCSMEPRERIEGGRSFGLPWDPSGPQRDRQRSTSR